MIRLLSPVLLLYWLSWGAFAQTPRMKIILDTDVGTDIDDAWALAFVALHPRLEPLGVTISDADTPARAKVACKLLYRAGRMDIPVAVGRKTPTPDGRVDHQFFWAEDFAAYKPDTKSAADFIVDTIKRHPGEVILLAVGPLQNIADALRKEPDLGRRLLVLAGRCCRSHRGEKRNRQRDREAPDPRRTFHPAPLFLSRARDPTSARPFSSRSPASPRSDRS